MQGIRFGNLSVPPKQIPTYSSFISLPTVEKKDSVELRTVEPAKTLEVPARMKSANSNKSKSNFKKALWGGLFLLAAAVTVKKAFFTKITRPKMHSADKMYDLFRENFDTEVSERRDAFTDLLSSIGDKVLKRSVLRELNGGCDCLRALKYLIAAEKVGIEGIFGQVPNVISLFDLNKNRIPEAVKELADIYSAKHETIDAAALGEKVTESLTNVLLNAKNAFKQDKTRTFLYLKNLENLSRIDELKQNQILNFLQNCADESGIIAVIEKEQLKFCKSLDAPDIELTVGHI